MTLNELVAHCRMRHIDPDADLRIVFAQQKEAREFKIGMVLRAPGDRIFLHAGEPQGHPLRKSF